MKKNLQAVQVLPAPHAGSSTIGMDLGDRWSRYCVVDQEGEIVKEDRVRTSTDALEQRFQQMPATRIVMEASGFQTLQ